MIDDGAAFLDNPQSARRWCDERRGDGKSIGLVPTMGAMHDGHLALVRRAIAENDACVASIFVNPLQFDRADDFEAYPRDLAADLRALFREGCAMAFTGAFEEFFPGAPAPRDVALLDPGPFAAGLEGEYRPGHFAGVATIVDRLFDVARPERAYFGAKDFQQALVVCDLARAKGFPRVVVCPTVREPDGLAMSSRNRRLSDAERRRAGGLYEALRAARQAWVAGRREARALRAAMVRVLDARGIEWEYAELRDPEDWRPGPPRRDAIDAARVRALVAARVGPVRLIDNLRLDGSGQD